MTFKEYEAQEPSTRYCGIRVSTAGIAKTISLDRILKERGWQRAKIFHDKENGAIKFERCEKDGYKLEWNHAIHAKIYREMPQGKYLLQEEHKNYLIFIKEI